MMSNFTFQRVVQRALLKLKWYDEESDNHLLLPQNAVATLKCIVLYQQAQIEGLQQAVQILADKAGLDASQLLTFATPHLCQPHDEGTHFRVALSEPDEQATPSTESTSS